MYPALFTVMPLVYPVGEKSVIKIHAKYPHAQKLLDTTTQIRCIRVHSPLDDRRHSFADDAPCDFIRQGNGDLEFTHLFPKEDEYSVELRKPDPSKPDVWHRIAMFQIYALEQDLFTLRPYRGDFHLHSTASDGSQPGEYVAATARKIGLDFMALTDHVCYRPSLELMQFMEKTNPDFKCFPGEEVHPYENPVHIVNFGGAFSVNDLMYHERERFENESKQLADSLSPELHELTREQVAKSEWAFDKIRESGGLAIFAHPYWRPGGKKHVPGRQISGLHNYIGDEVIDVLLDRYNFDAMELFAGYPEGEEECHHLGLALYQREMLRKNGNFPAIGVTDSHDCEGELFGWCSTIIFAESPEFSSLAKGIKDCRSVAVLSLPDTDPLLAGPFRLTKFSYFLLRTFYPVHDELCRIEGDLMLRILAGEKDKADAEDALKRRIGGVPDLFRTMWK